jgi:hypothetical protein
MAGVESSGARAWLGLRLGWFIVFAAGIALTLLGHGRVGGAVLGVGAIVVGLGLALDLSNVARGAVDWNRKVRTRRPTRRRGWGTPTGMNGMRLFGVAFSAVGVVFLVLGLTNHFGRGHS